MSVEDLVQAALRARENAFAPYSSFKVGAALETTDGKIFTGCNVENSTYGLTVCAERVALWKAISEGERKFRRIVVTTATEHPGTPCGPCRQLMWEFCGDIEIILANPQGYRETHRLSGLYPRPFDATSL
jgi:cytidine deaminase